MRNNSTLNGRARETVVPALARYVRDQATTANDALGHLGQRHVAALTEFAEFVSGRALDDQRVYALGLIGARLGNGSGYEPGSRQRELFGRLGVDRVAPLAEDTLNELVALAIADLIDRSGEEVGDLQRKLDQAQVDSEAMQELRARAQTAEEDAEQARADLAEAEERERELTKQIDHLKEMVAGDDETSDQGDDEGGNEAPRRVSLHKETKRPEHKGIHYRDTDQGRLYEIGWREDGRQRWRRTGPDLNEAIAERAKITEPEGAAA